MEYEGLNKLTLLQIGDIHYPQVKDKWDIDNKDTGIPIPFAHTLAPKILQKAIRSITNVFNKYNVDGILFCGDLTSFGNYEGYKECIKYMNQSLEIGKDGKWLENQIHVVPGNHDFHRNSCDPTGEDKFGKFDSLNIAWHGFPVLCNNASRMTKIESPASGNRTNIACIYSANSCIGCGVTRSFPEPVRIALSDAIQAYEENADSDKAFELRGEILDTPAFDETIFSEICGEIDSLNNMILPIIVSHHNILPQVTPRVALYTELLNGGLFRDHLTSRHKSILYCHGHIHADPIEIVFNQKYNSGKLVCISAPELIEGFNLIIVEYAANGIPIGCRVLPYRDEGGEHRFSSEQRISLYERNSSVSICNDETIQIVQNLSSESKRFSEILTKARELLDRDIQKRTLANMLLEAEWFGLVEISDKYDGTNSAKLSSPVDWHIKSI